MTKITLEDEQTIIVLQVIDELESCTLQEIADELDAERPLSLMRHLHILEDLGVIERIQGDAKWIFDVTYEVIEDAEGVPELLKEVRAWTAVSDEDNAAWDAEEQALGAHNESIWEAARNGDREVR